MQELKEFRSSISMTATQFAESLGISRSLYEKVEQGCRKPSNNFLSRLKKRYPQFDINIFFNRE